MAQKVTTVVEMTDDIDGSKADRTILFGYDGAMYEIDLSRKNAATFSRVLRPYLDNARKVRGTRSRAAARRSAKPRDPSEIRAWAKSNGYQISGRGRIPGEVIAAFDAQ